MNTNIPPIPPLAVGSATETPGIISYPSGRFIETAATIVEAAVLRDQITELLGRYPPKLLDKIKFRKKSDEEMRAFFWSNVKIGQLTDCWLWHGSTLPSGNRAGDLYGRPSIGGKFDMAHRLAYRFTKGEIPDRVTKLDFNTCYQAYRRILLGFIPSPVTNVSTVAEFLSIAEREGWQSGGVPAFDLYTRELSPRQIRRIQKDMASCRPAVHKIDWSELLPADGPPTPIELISKP